MPTVTIRIATRADVDAALLRVRASVNRLTSDLNNNVRSGFSRMTTSVRGFATRMSGHFRSSFADIRNRTTTLTGSMRNGFLSAFNSIGRGIRGMASGFVSALRNPEAKINGMATAFATLGPAIVPATAALATFGATVGAALVPVAAFTAAVIPQISAMKAHAESAGKVAAAQQDAANKQKTADMLSAQGSSLAERAQKSATSAKLKAIQAQTAYAKETKDLPKGTADAAVAFARLKSAFSSWSDSLANTTMPVFTKGMDLLRKLIPSLTPFVKIAAKEISKLMDVLSKKVDSKGFDEMVKKFASFSGDSLRRVIGGVTNLYNMIKGWVLSEGFKNFISLGAKEGPGLAKMFQNLAEFVGKFVAAAGPMGGISLKVLEILADVLNSIPYGAMKIIVPTILGIAAAVKIWTAAQVLLNIALDANPIGIIIVALAALALAFNYAWKKSETFREIVVTVLGALAVSMASTAKIILQGLKLITDGFLTFAQQAIHAAATAFGWVPGIGPKLKTADKAFQGLRKGVDNAFDGMIKKSGDFSKAADKATQERKLKMRIDDWTNKIATAKKQLNTVPKDKQAKLKGDIADLQRKIASAKNQISGLHGKTVTFTYKTVGYIPTAAQVNAMNHSNRAMGGIIGAAGGGPRSNMTLVGEHGPELVNLAPGSTVRTNSDTRRLLSGGGGGSPIMYLTLKIGDKALGDLLIDPIRKTVRTRGGNVQAVLGTGG